jgi:hypothetical protein
MSEIRTWEEMKSSGEYDDYDTMARAFAKMHVTAALHIASERADLTDNGSFPYVDKLSILNSYPLDKIK